MSKKRRNAANPYGDPIAMIGAMLAVVRELPDKYDEAYDIVGQAEMEHQDLIHEIELLTLSRKDAAEVMAALRDNRRIRREAKDFMELSKPLYDFVRKHKNLVNELIQISQEMNRTKRTMGERIYIPRVRHEKTEDFIQLTAFETGKSPDDIREGLQKAGRLAYDETAASD